MKEGIGGGSEGSECSKKVRRKKKVREKNTRERNMWMTIYEEVVQRNLQWVEEKNDMYRSGKRVSVRER